MATEVTIYSASGEERFSTPVNEGGKRVYKLMGDDYVELPFSVETPVAFALGDYADIEGFGRFVITDSQRPEYNTETGGYDYTLKMEAQYRSWKNRIYKFIPQVGTSECSWTLTANARTHMEQVLKNIAVLCEASSAFKYNGTDSWEFAISEDVDSKVAVTVSFDGVNIIDAIAAIAEAFDCEWWVDNNVIHLGKCETDDDYIDLEIGVNVESMTSSATNELQATRIFPYGGTNNIPSNYRQELIFSVTDVDDEDDTRVRDASRPLDPEWFPSEVVSSKRVFSEAVGVHTHSTGIVNNVFTETGDIRLQFDGQSSLSWPLKIDIPDLAVGEYWLDLTGYSPVFWRDSAGTAIVNSMFVRITVQGYYGSDRPSTTESHSQDVSCYLYRSGYDENGLPNTVTGVGQKTRIQITHDLTGCCINVTAYATVGTTGYRKLSCVPYGTIRLYSEKQAYRVDGIELSLRDGSNVETGTISDVAYNPDYVINSDDESNILLLPEGVTMLPGQRFKITNIQTEKVSMSYFSSVYGDGDNDVITNSALSKRLMLPEDGLPYIDAYDNMPEEEVIEAQVIYDDIYPKRTETVSDVTEEVKTVTEELEDGSSREVTNTYYRIKIENFTAETPFKQDYIVESVGGDEKLTINFTSGVLNGRSFELEFNPDNDDEDSEDAQVFRIVPDDSSSITVPNNILKPSVGDTFVLTNFKVHLINDQYVADAQEELRKQAQEDVEKMKEDAASYDCSMMSDYMAGYDGTDIIESDAMLPVLTIGRRVRLINPAYFETGRESRIIGMQYDLCVPYDTPVLTVGNKAAYSRLSNAESRIDALEAAMGSGSTGTAGGSSTTVAGGGTTSGGSVYLIKQSDTTPASDTNAYSALRAIAEFTRKGVTEKISALWRFLKGVTVGDYVTGQSGAAIDERGDAEVGMLEVRDAASIGGDVDAGGAVRAGGNVETDAEVSAGSRVIAPVFRTPDFVAGLLTGVGAGVQTLNGKTYAEVDYLTVRSGMTVAELLIQQYRSVGGALVVSAANGEVTAVDTVLSSDGTYMYALYLKDTANAPRFVAGDLVRCAHFDTSQNLYRTYWVEVLDVDYADEGCIYVSTMAFPDGVTPQEGDTLVQMGNTTDTNRQSCIVITTELGQPRIVVFDGINAPTIVGTNYRAIYGHLDGFTDPVSGDILSGYGLWSANVYLHGTFRLKSGKTIEVSLLDSLSGRRNYARGTATAVHVSSTKDMTNYTVPMYSIYGLKTGDVITVSFDYKYNGVLNGADGDAVISLQFGAAYGYASMGLRITDAGTTGMGSGHHSFTLTLGKTYPDENDIVTTDDGLSYLRFDNTLLDSTNGYFEVSNFMVTGGNTEAEWQEAPEDAFIAAAQAQSAADEAKDRLNSWAEDGVISPTEKQQIKDEIARINSDLQEIEQKYNSLNLSLEVEIGQVDTAWNYYIDAYNAYLGMLQPLTDTSVENIKIPDGFADTQSTYYSCRANILQALATSYQVEVNHLFEHTDEQFQSVYTRTESLANGGRNLLLQTNEGVRGWKASNGVEGGFSITEADEYTGNTGVQFTRNTTGEYDVFMFQLRPQMIKAGTKYILSFDAKLNEDGDTLDGSLLVQLCQSNGLNALLSGMLASDTVMTELGKWYHHVYELTPTADGSSDGEQVVYICVRSAETNMISGLSIVNLKLEEGTVPTAWSKAPEDLGEMAAVLKTDYESKITETAESIRSEVSKTVTALDGRITENSSAIEQTADDISLKVREKAIIARNHAYGTNDDVAVTDFDASGENASIMLYGVTGLKTGDVITVSFDITLPTVAAVAGAKMVMQLTDEFGWAAVGTVIPLSTENIMYMFGTRHITATVTLGQNSSGEDIAESDTGFIYLRCDNLSASLDITVSRLKVEVGHTETEWTPLTTDVVTSLKETGIDIELDKITLKAPKTEVVAYDADGNEYSTAVFTTKEVIETAEDGTTTKTTVPVLNAALVEVDGLTAKRLIAVDSSSPAQVVSTVNVVDEDGKYYTHYPVTYDSDGNADSSTVYAEKDGYKIGYPASCFGYDPETDYVMNVFYPTGTPKTSKWGLRIGSDNGKYGIVARAGTWKSVGMRCISDSVEYEQLTNENGGVTLGDEVLLTFPTSVQWSKENGIVTAVPVYGDLGTAIAIAYKEFAPGNDSQYDNYSGFVKSSSDTSADNDFTSGITGMYVRSSRPVQGSVYTTGAGETKIYNVPFTWTVYVYQNGLPVAIKRYTLTPQIYANEL